MKVYIVVVARKSMFDSGYEKDIFGVYLSRDSALTAILESGYSYDASIEEHEVNQ